MESGNDIYIQCSNVSRSIRATTILNQINMKVRRGEIYGLLGPSGSGKTSLVRLIAGMDIPSSGSVTIQGQQVPQLKLLERIGYMAQSDALYTELTAKENLRFFGAMYGLKGAELIERMSIVMELVGLGAYLNSITGAFSGGMKRRLSLAIAMLHQPQLLILDEPTVGIDPVLRRSIWKKLEELSSDGTTILLTTHVMDEAERCHRLGMIRGGELIAEGTPTKLKELTKCVTLEGAFLKYGGGVEG